MRSRPHGKTTSAVEVTRITAHGLWLLLDGREFHLPFTEFPWFRDATVRQITAVTRVSPDHLRWAQLDVDLELESIEHPERYPLISKVPLSVAEPKSRRTPMRTKRR